MDMDHSHMDHGAMDHGAMDHGSPMDENMMRCSMNMLFTWNTENLCIIFRQWHITSTFTLLVSLLAIVVITAGYEALRQASRRYEKWVAKETGAIPSVNIVTPGGGHDRNDEYNDTESTPLFWSGRNQAAVNKKAHIIKALLYAFQSFYAFMLMLLFMTYNGWVMVAMFVGGFLGYLFFGLDIAATKDGACH